MYKTNPTYAEMLIPVWGEVSYRRRMAGASDEGLVNTNYRRIMAVHLINLTGLAMLITMLSLSCSGNKVSSQNPNHTPPATEQTRHLLVPD